LGDSNHWVRTLPGKLLQNIVSHGVAKIAEFLIPGEVRVLVHGFTSPLMRGIGETEIVDELRFVASDQRNTTAYFTFTTQAGPPIQEFRLFGPRGALTVDNLHRTVVEHNASNSTYKSYLNFFVPSCKLAQQHASNVWMNMKAFLKADFHMDAGMKNLITAFYDSIRNDTAPPLPNHEILLTTELMDDVFSQLDSAPGSTRRAGDEGWQAPATLSGRAVL